MRSRTSSGAGKTMELHLHLIKGHAWEWEERRRLEDLEEVERHPPSLKPNGHAQASSLSMNALDVGDLLDSNTHIPTNPIIPSSLIDSQPVQLPDPFRQTYPTDGMPIQLFLTGTQVVPEALRRLLQEMLDPLADQRPTARTTLLTLERLQQIAEEN